jgi:hypothetical protein
MPPFPRTIGSGRRKTWPRGTRAATPSPPCAASWQDTGYQVDFATYFFGFLPLPILLLRALPFRLGLQARSGSPETLRSDHQVACTGARRMLGMWTRWEVSRIARRRTLPLGGSCLIVGQIR